MNIKLLLFGLCAFLTVSCNKPTPKNIIVDRSGTEHEVKIVADSITYEVIVQLHNDDAWEAERLAGYTNHKALIDGIFKNVLSGKLKAYDYATNEYLTPEEVKKMLAEKSVDESQVGKLLFTEKWYIDSKGYLQKEVLSITFGKAEYSKQGTFKGYSALFKVKY
ncbi:hypothetical protein [Tenuifilum thalassicum]|uniref:Uncharacterized protein n=1 Tax=Tenuifilum thalassicum TaxID=2590900 RepID=A0A7D4CFM4_9BACT|nr:hypothetical protein [Tenuifilum thalassicum]QKG79126.1 hypothetical protein FHG85_02205 [Tenuifilum thalassicum]